MTRTFGAAIGALIVMFFMSYMATCLTHPVSASVRTQSIAQR